jgi:hypothetical protein
MNSSEPDPPPAPGDDELRRALRSLPIPETPSGLESRVRGRILRRRVRRTAAASTALALVVCLLVWRPWVGDNEVVNPVPPRPGPVAQAAPQIPPEELDVLFAPPPVDSLTILARRDEASVGALNRLEGAK